MKPVVLSERMRAVAHMVSAGSAVCDVGCDHGFVSVYLVQQRISPRVLAMDLREGPLGAAREHVAAYCLEDRIEVRLSDGLHKYEIGEADTLVCAGMGGGLMRRILEEEPEKASSFRELVLQPQSEAEAFRRFLRVSGYTILDELMLEEEGKFYRIMRVAPGKEGVPNHAGQPERQTGGALSEDELCKLEDRYGPILLRKKTPVFLAYLDREAKIYGEILESLQRQGLTKERRRTRYEQIETLLKDNRLARSFGEAFP